MITGISTVHVAINDLVDTEHFICGAKVTAIGVNSTTVDRNSTNTAAATAQNDYTDPVTGENATFTGTESWDDFTPKVGLTYELENGIAYATYSEGFRSGGFNGRATGANNAGPYDPETVESFEFGIKTIWANNTFQFNASAFTVDYTGFGWVLIKKGVWEHEEMKYPWFAPKMQVFESGEVQDMCGEDVSFCLDALNAGFEIWCDPRIRVGHEKQRVI